MILAGCTLGGGAERKTLDGAASSIATCGAGVTITKRGALSLSMDGGLGLSVGRRTALRAAFLDGFPVSDMPARVLAYTKYVGCVTNQEEKELALSQLLERKIRFISHMKSQKLGDFYVGKVSMLYDQQYALLQQGAVAQANEKLGNIAVAYFDAVQAKGIPIGPLAPMPAPAPPPVGGDKDSAPPTPDQLRQERLDRAKRWLEYAAADNAQSPTGIYNAADACAEVLGTDICFNALYQ